MKISIIIPMYNCEKSILNTLNSVLNQTYQNYEVICVDDGSKDKTFDIVNSMAKLNKSIKLVHTENFGVSHARNIGLSMISKNTDIIMFLDSDDLLLPDAFKIVIENMKDNSIVTYSYKKNNKIISLELFENNFNKKEYYEMLSKKDLFNQLWNKAYSKECVKDIRFNENLNLGEDLDFNIQCLKKAKKISYIDQYFYHYFLYSNGLSLRKRRNIFEVKYEMLQNVKEFYSFFNYEPSYLNKLYFKAYLQGLYFEYENDKFSVNNLKKFNLKVKKKIDLKKNMTKSKFYNFVVKALLMNNLYIYIIFQIGFRIYYHIKMNKKVKK